MTEEALKLKIERLLEAGKATRFKKGHNAGGALSDETRAKVKQNHAHYWKGKKHSEELKIKRGVYLTENQAKRWKGDEVGYDALHKWVKKHLGSATYCINGHKESPRFVWANKSGEYRRNLDDWHQLCSRCNSNDGVRIPTHLKRKKKRMFMMRGEEKIEF